MEEDEPGRLRRDFLVALLAINGILCHLVLRFAIHSTAAIFRVPLYVVLVIGGLPLIVTLMRKFLGRSSHSRRILGRIDHCLDAFGRRFAQNRVHEALDMAIGRTESERAAQLVKILPQLEGALSKSAKIAIKTKGRILFVDPADVVIVEAQGNYVLLGRPSGSYLLRESISTMAEKLKAYGFIRIHRSVLVNGSFVEEIEPWPTGEYVLRIKGGQGIHSLTHYKSNLKSLAKFWIGADTFVTN